MHESALSAAQRAGRGAARGTEVLRTLGSPRLALWLIALLGAGVLVLHVLDLPTDWCLSAPLALLGVNLLAAVATHAAFRAQAALLVFHLALAAVAFLAAIGRLTYLQAQAEVATGRSFRGDTVRLERGILHPARLEDAVFENRGFDIEYEPGMKRGRTRNAVQWQDGAGRPAAAVIGDQDPLVLGGYRFYTTPNKGFAPRLLWTPPAGEPQVFDLHFPAYPVFQFGQDLEWNLPRTTQTVTVSLHIDETVIDPGKASRFRVPERHRLRIDAAGSSVELKSGEATPVAGGRLVYLGLGSWMGYKIFYDWTLPWLLAAAALAALALAAHFLLRFRARPWNEDS